MAADLELHPSELIFGLVYPVGTDADQVTQFLRWQLERFGYQLEVIRLSQLLPDVAPHLGVELAQAPQHFERFMTHMTAGNLFRDRVKRGEALAEYAITELRLKRSENDPEKQGTPRERTAYLLRSLKHHEEVALLRRVYGAGFYLLGVNSSEERRRKHLQQDLGISEEHVDQLIKRDEDEKAEDFGQRTRDTFQLADVFLDADDLDVTKQQLNRFLRLVFGDPFKTPTRDEYAMFMAHAASRRSGELSRQVGAVVLSARGELVSVGVNEVPAPEGGLYWEGDLPDGRDFAKLGYDSNHRMREQIIADYTEALRSEVHDALLAAEWPESVTPATLAGIEEELLKRANKSLREGGLKDITEFGRAVHAEMEALLSCLRSGISPCGGTLVVTTYPCHTCARHIIAAGIARVVYIEPYPKSKTGELHGEAILLGKQSEAVSRRGVRFEPFVGVGPRRYLELFSMSLGLEYPLHRKNRDGSVKSWQEDGALPRIPLLSSSYLEREDGVTSQLQADLLKLRQDTKQRTAS